MEREDSAPTGAITYGAMVRRGRIAAVLLAHALVCQPLSAQAEIELLAFAGWPIYQRQTEVTGAAMTGASRFPDFGPQENLVYGGGLTWWTGDHLGFRGDFLIYNPNVPPNGATADRGWKQRILAGSLNILGRWAWTERLTPYAGIGLAKTSAKQCDHLGCTPSTDGWGATGTVGLAVRLTPRISLFTEARHLSTSFRFANIPDGAFASDVNLNTVHLGLTWEAW